MNKQKLFLENFFLYGFGGIINKIIPLVMVPIITRIMPSTEYYGISDLSNTIVQFGCALAIMGMYDAMYRMFFEKNEEAYKLTVCSTTLLFTVGTSLVVFIFMIGFRETIAYYFFGNAKYTYVVLLSAIATLVSATNNIVSAPTRMQNKRKVFLITNTISPLLSYAISIPLLLAGYYVIALPLAAVISGITMEISFGIMNYTWFNIRKFDRKLLKKLLTIALPVFPNFLVYWIFNSFDKIMISNMIGIEATGIYSVGAKLGHASQLIYTAFAGGWQYFAFSTMKENDQVKSNSMIFEYLGIISFIVSSYICAWSYPIIKMLFTRQYLDGYIVAPYLFMAPMLQMLFQVAANQFLVVKKTWPNMLILSTGAVLNVFLNWTLIPIFGIEGASIATLSGYIVSDIICVIVLCKMKLMVMSKKFVVSAVVMMIFLFVWRIWFSRKIFIGTGLAIIITFIFAFIYRSDVKKLIYMVKNRNLRKV